MTAVFYQHLCQYIPCHHSDNLFDVTFLDLLVSGGDEPLERMLDLKFHFHAAAVVSCLEA